MKAYKKKLEYTVPEADLLFTHLQNTIAATSPIPPVDERDDEWV